MQQPDFIKSAFKTQHQQVYGSSREAVLNRDLVLNTATVPVTEFKHPIAIGTIGIKYTPV
jgi:hypothetical protein